MQKEKMFPWAERLLPTKLVHFSDVVVGLLCCLLSGLMTAAVPHIQSMAPVGTKVNDLAFYGPAIVFGMVGLLVVVSAWPSSKT